MHETEKSFLMITFGLASGFSCSANSCLTQVPRCLISKSLHPVSFVYVMRHPECATAVFHATFKEAE